MRPRRNLNEEPFERGELHDISLADIRLVDLEVTVRHCHYPTFAELAKRLKISYFDIERAIYVGRRYKPREERA